MKLNVLILLSISILVGGCSSKLHTEKSDSKLSEVPIPTQEHSIQAVLWQQRAAEYRALCLQAYNAARYSLDEMLASANKNGKPLAIVTDLDETVIDNSPFNAKMIELDEPYKKEDWIEWGDEVSAEGVPGAVAFFNYASSKGVEIFYISNRYPEQLEVTIENLRKLNLPFVDQAHVWLRGESSSKKERRSKVEETHEIIMFLGDNLADFSDLFEYQQSERRLSLVDSLKPEFGTKFIVLPNVMYGDWQTRGIYEGRYDWTEAQKDSIRHSKLISY